jgi:hypothetical protein
MRIRFILIGAFLCILSGFQSRSYGLPDPPEDLSLIRYETIDKHALSTPASSERSVKSLAEYLIRPARNDEEKARAIFRWITAKITYDTRAYFTGELSASNSDLTLGSRKAVCGGFSSLFQDLGKAAGIRIETIHGYAKGYGSGVGEHFKGPSNHAWNAVWIDGQWWLMDATWGGGYVNENGAYVRSFNGYFFFTPPEKFIYTHFPENPEWQLLRRPVSRNEFEKMAFVRPGFFLNGLELNSHRASEIEAMDTATVTIRAPEETVLLAHLVRDDVTLESGLAFVQKDRGLAIVRAAFPSTGIYVLRIFAKRRSDPGPAEWVLDYRVRAKKVRIDAASFPETYRTFSDCGGFLASPMQGKLKSGTIYGFRIRIPGAEKAAVKSGKKWADLKGNGNWFEGEIKAMKGEMHVFAKFPGDANYSGLLKYIAN